MADEDPITQVEGEPAPASPLTEYSVVYTDRALNLCVSTAAAPLCQAASPRGAARALSSL